MHADKNSTISHSKNPDGSVYVLYKTSEVNVKVMYHNVYMIIIIIIIIIYF
jgi:hypothetical protein